MKNTLAGECRVRVCGAFPEAVLNACAMQAVELWDMICENENTIIFSVTERNLDQTAQIAEKCMCSMELISCRGGSQSRKLLKNHIWLLISAVFMLVLLYSSTLFIWDIKIYGCEELAEGEVVRALADCGVGCGTYWPKINNELIRSEMLCRLPELAWMTINISGSRAAVLVSERDEKPEIYVETQGADIISSATGIIKKISVLNGKPMTEKGKSVVKGETLISGLMESLSREPRCVRASGEVEAFTWYEYSSVCPSGVKEKVQDGRIKRRFALKLGDHRINLYFSSRKDVDECDKIVHNYILGIDGVFALPISLTEECFVPYELTMPSKADTVGMGERMSSELDDRIDGELLNCSITAAENDELIIVSMRASCRENIARIKEYIPADLAP